MAEVVTEHLGRTADDAGERREGGHGLRRVPAEFSLGSCLVPARLRLDAGLAEGPEVSMSAQTGQVCGGCQAGFLD